MLYKSILIGITTATLSYANSFAQGIEPMQAQSSSSSTPTRYFTTTIIKRENPSLDKKIFDKAIELCTPRQRFEAIQQFNEIINPDTGNFKKDLTLDNISKNRAIAEYGLLIFDFDDEEKNSLVSKILDPLIDEDINFTSEINIPDVKKNQVIAIFGISAAKYYRQFHPRFNNLFNFGEDSINAHLEKAKKALEHVLNIAKKNSINENLYNNPPYIYNELLSTYIDVVKIVASTDYIQTLKEYRPDQEGGRIWKYLSIKNQIPLINNQLEICNKAEKIDLFKIFLKDKNGLFNKKFYLDDTDYEDENKELVNLVFEYYSLVINIPDENKENYLTIPSAFKEPIAKKCDEMKINFYPRFFD
ncbi:MAG: hypothetical protein IJ730_02370 [Alphaproteobacteria bacterium]|nr:hypothetical protein [Alphaproteobacteria bacterium]